MFHEYGNYIIQISIKGSNPQEFCINIKEDKNIYNFELVSKSSLNLRVNDIPEIYLIPYDKDNSCLQSINKDYQISSFKGEIKSKSWLKSIEYKYSALPSGYKCSYGFKLINFENIFNTYETYILIITIGKLQRTLSLNIELKLRYESLRTTKEIVYVNDNNNFIISAFDDFNKPYTNSLLNKLTVSLYNESVYPNTNLISNSSIIKELVDNKFNISLKISNVGKYILVISLNDYKIEYRINVIESYFKLNQIKGYLIEVDENVKAPFKFNLNLESSNGAIDYKTTISLLKFFTVTINNKELKSEDYEFINNDSTKQVFINFKVLPFINDVFSFNIIYKFENKPDFIIFKPEMIIEKAKLSNFDIYTNSKQFLPNSELEFYIIIYNSREECLSINKDYVISNFNSNISGNNTKCEVAYKYIENIGHPKCKTGFKLEIKEKFTKYGEYLLTVNIDKIKKTLKFIINYGLARTIQITQITETDVNAGDENKYELKVYDEYKSLVSDFNYDTIKYDFYLVKDNTRSLIKIPNLIKAKIEKINNENYLIANITKTGNYEVEFYIDSSLTNPKAKVPINVFANKCHALYTNIENKNDLTEFSAGDNIQRIFNCKDQYNNHVLKEEDVSSFKIEIHNSVNNSKLDNKQYTYSIKYISNGSYKVDFEVFKTGAYYQYVTIRGNNINNKYSFTIISLICKAPTPLLCPNIFKCVKDYKFCLNKNDFSCYEKNPNKPFYCQQTNECVSSQSDCKINISYVKCPNTINSVWIPKDKENLCPRVLDITSSCSQKSPLSKVMCPEGNCVPDESFCASKRVCPIGKVLCLDLTCRNSLNDCNTKVTCKENELICSDLTCVTDQKNCPTQITCPNKGDVVCPDGSCVNNEMNCKALPICPDETPFLCSNNKCVTSSDNCTKSLSCGHGKVLCSQRSACQECNCSVI